MAISKKFFQKFSRWLLAGTLLLAALVAAIFWRSASVDPFRPLDAGDRIGVSQDGSARIAQAYREHRSGLWVGGQGRVIKILPDDLKGSRHQRFILSLPSEQTILISHNIDLAPRIEHLKIGDEIYFYGEYLWNAKGGLVHWTHHDPRQVRDGGWLEHQGKRYR